MLHARLDLITADPLRLGESVSYLESEVRPAVEGLRANLGMSLLANPGLGAAVLESFWVSHDALLDSEQAVAPLRSEIARRAGGTVIAERYRIPVFEREAPLGGGEGVRLTRMVAGRAAFEDAIEVFGDTAVPWLAEFGGFRGALLFADPASGHLISETVWQDPAALAASPGAAAVARFGGAGPAGCVIRAVEEYTLVFSSARKA